MVPPEQSRFLQNGEPREDEGDDRVREVLWHRQGRGKPTFLLKRHEIPPSSSSVKLDQEGF
jgi:hypothetical protein